VRVSNNVQAGPPCKVPFLLQRVGMTVKACIAHSVPPSLLIQARLLRVWRYQNLHSRVTIRAIQERLHALFQVDRQICKSVSLPKAAVGMSSLVGVADRLQQFTRTRTALPADSPMTPRPCRPQQNVPILLVHQQLRYCAAPVGVKSIAHYSY
jgi:hypothetical protein